MKLVYAKQEGRIANFYIGGVIGKEVNGTYIEADIMFINNNKSADKINIYINSEGGDVINGSRIISAIFYSKIPVHTYNMGFSYSMGGYIWLAAKKDNRHCSFFSSLMLHAARYVNESGEIIEPEQEDDRILLQVINNMLSDIGENATDKSKKEMYSILSKDSFFTPDQCVNNGFMNSANIIKYNDMPQFKPEATIAEKIKVIAAFYQEQKTNNLKNNTMKSVTAKLGLTIEASEQAITEKIDAIISEKVEAVKSVQTLETKLEEKDEAIQAIEAQSTEKITELEAKITVFETKENELKAEMAKTVVATFEKEGKIKADQKEDMIAMATENLEGFNKFMSAINFTVKGVDIVAKLEDSSALKEAAAKLGIKVEELTYETLEAKGLLSKVKAENKTLYDSLEKIYTEKYS